ncbi:transmembrane protein 200B [Crotalus tigris]|uniref:transmembrane protein 200B n=1 Tax=Crotalus tigris TaxID=88082 RepID=UPI00192F1C85|nr:transmembrane protein 200B [Crotalus tigris]XP_039190284.1 transmembrane protein 200B [Crotalus tigris]XP_039190285.1 transmembrane protein 200B [Crotalus tigris]XP_039190286.1 transmembrane protein 200B [Crotalus tigris]XP_039190288.1 transmembrane protein 200B [Crotalus tigris]XP_039190289.1 transmembrane protein 200B [Crotalus tigris]
MKTHNTSEKKTSGSSGPSRWHRGRFRRKPSPQMVVKGQLRMRSPSGVFVMVGISVVLVGMTIAVIGYWPHHTKSGSGRPGNSSVAGDIRKEIKVSPQAHPFLHSEKLKLIGPVVMGVGLFIFICANTLLYENRDMETRLLMQQELYSMGLNFPQDTGPTSDYFQRRRTTSSTLRANAECVEGYYEVDLSSSGFQSCSSPVKKWVNSCNSSRLQTTTQFFHHKSLSPSLSLLSIHSDCSNTLPENEAFSFARGAESVLSTAVNALPLPLIKLNNCLLEKQSVSQVGIQDLEGSCRLPEEREEIRRFSWALLPGCNHILPRKDTLKGSHIVIDMDSTPHSGNLVDKFHECAKRVFPHLGHSKSLDLGQRRTALVAPSIERKHRSWPRLDHIDLLNYAKLESQGESSDRLLEASKELFRGESISLSQEMPVKTGPII